VSADIVTGGKEGREKKGDMFFYEAGLFDMLVLANCINFFI